MAHISRLWPHHLSLRSIRGRLALLLALAFLPAGIIAFQAGVSSLQSRNAALQGQQGVRVLHRLSVLRDDATQLREGVRTLAASADLFADSARRCHEILEASAEEFDAHSVLTILDRDAVVRCSNVAEAQGKATAATSLIDEARRIGGVAFGFVPAPHLSAGPVMGAVAPVETGDAEEALYVGATAPLRPLLEIARAPDRARPGFVALIDAQGRLLEGVNIAAGDAIAAELSARARAEPIARQRAAFQIGDVWAVAMPLEEDGRLYVVSGWTPAPGGFAQWARAAWALLGPLLLWLGAVGATWLAVEYFVARPLSVVEGLARAYARGEDSESDEALIRNAPAEIASLRRTLAAMAKTLRGREARIATALQEERALLLEVNHRVKNNLQMVASILSIQARAAENPAEARGLARAQDRVQLLALAHARIYSSGEVRHIALDQLANDIVRALVVARGAEAAGIRLDLSLAPVRANADRAVPLSFLIGESIAAILDLNATGAGIESMRVALTPRGDEGFDLEIDATAGNAQTPGLSATGQRLIGAFARQMGAVIDHDSSRCCHVRITLEGAASGAA